MYIIINKLIKTTRNSVKSSSSL